MINYTVDGSVYIFPLHAESPNIEYMNIIKKDVVALMNRINLNYHKQPCNEHFYFSKNDFKLFINQCIQPRFTVGADDILEKINKHNGLYKKYKEQIDYLTIMFTRMGFKDSNIENIRKSYQFVSIESWFNIEDIENINEIEKLLPDIFYEKIKDDKQLTNIKKNIAMISALNAYVYKNNFQHNLILSKNFSLEKLVIYNFEFNVLMENGKYTDNNIENNYQYKIKDMPAEKICIENQEINVSIIDKIIKTNKIFTSIEEAYNKAKMDFKDQLEFGNDVDYSIKQYTDKINKILNTGKYNIEIKEWLEISPDIVYKNLETLNNFIIYNNFKKINLNAYERYHCCKGNEVKTQKCDYSLCIGASCNKKCDFLEYCGSYIHFFGVDCVDEYRKRELDIREDRKWKDSQGNKQLYWHHLRLNTYNCTDDLWFLTLRIHFRHIVVDDVNKLEIGWIGRHLFLGCEKKDRYDHIIRNCKREKECPINPSSRPLHDPTLSDYENFKKQW